MSVADAHLVRALDGDRAEDAARALYRAYGGELFGFAVHRLRDRGLAEEVVQDVFVRVWRHAGEYDARRSSVRTWLYAITRNALKDAERRRRRRPDPPPAHSAERSGADEPIERAVLRWQLALALARLTPDHREVIELTQIQGLRLTEIAERAGLPLGTVKSRAFYALQSLRLALEELGVEP